MTFEVFFNLIFDILGGGKDIAVFMRELFDQIGATGKLGFHKPAIRQGRTNTAEVCESQRHQALSSGQSGKADARLHRTGKVLDLSSNLL